MMPLMKQLTIWRGVLNENGKDLQELNYIDYMFNKEGEVRDELS